ncbi:unnamed protein product [Pleuronectes platessa]|uniref:Uncharacterized protein n=1 Tax=Pleuronectes platessa TaxID=8262 RepID=A0A9N7YP21_PLEPL|nr:unnamed protein product [Pleuronectes platessa]
MMHGDTYVVSAGTREEPLTLGTQRALVSWELQSAGTTCQGIKMDDGDLLCVQRMEHNLAQMLNNSGPRLPLPGHCKHLLLSDLQSRSRTVRRAALDTTAAKLRSLTRRPGCFFQPQGPYQPLEPTEHGTQLGSRDEPEPL